MCKLFVSDCSGIFPQQAEDIDAALLSFASQLQHIGTASRYRSVWSINRVDIVFISGSLIDM